MLSQQLHKTIDKAQALWCEFFHDQAMWPINGHYQCRTCLRYTAVPWEHAAQAASENRHSSATLQLVPTRSAPGSSTPLN